MQRYYQSGLGWQTRIFKHAIASCFLLPSLALYSRN
jgi:hypothetical protein